LKGYSAMKLSFLYPFLIALMVIMIDKNVAAQDFKGGTVTYQHFTKYKFEKIFAEHIDKIKEYFGGTIPQEKTRIKVLHFSEEAALYGENPDIQENRGDQKLNGLIMRANMSKPPMSVMEKVFYDFGKNEIIRQVEFMTRNFLVSDEIKSIAWKLTDKKIKVQDYNCMSAELIKGDKTVTAYFTPEIPVSIGPDEFYGLPGLILVVEVDGETAFMATSIDLTPPEEGNVSRPDNGKKVTQEEFNIIVAEKVREYQETKVKGRDKGKGLRR